VNGGNRVTDWQKDVGPQYDWRKEVRAIRHTEANCGAATKRKQISNWKNEGRSQKNESKNPHTPRPIWKQEHVGRNEQLVGGGPKKGAQIKIKGEQGMDNTSDGIRYQKETITFINSNWEGIRREEANNVCPVFAIENDPGKSRQ